MRDRSIHSVADDSEGIDTGRWDVLKNAVVGVLMLALAGYGAVKASLDGYARYKVALILAPLGRGFDIHYHNVSASLFGPISISRLSIASREDSAESVTIDKLVVRDYQMVQGEALPRHLSLSVEDLRVDPDLLRLQGVNDLPRWLRNLKLAHSIVEASDLSRLGYSDFDVDLQLDFSFSPGSGDMDLDLHQQARDLADIGLRFSVSGFAARQMDRGPSAVKFRSARLSYTDRSFAHRLIEHNAEAAHEDVHAYSEGLIDAMLTQLAVQHVDLDKDSVEGIKRFLRKPGRLMVTLEPDEPVPLAHLKFYRPGDYPALLNLQVVAH